jgi:hypothetical protein
MKRLLVSFALVLCATAAFAQAADRDVLVTLDGTVYTVTTETPYRVVTELPLTGTSTDAVTLLDLAIQSGSNVRHMVIPASMSYGYHFGGALAYDSDSKTLFVLWIHMPNQMSSELLLASYHDGAWQPAISIDPQPYLYSSNLRLGITRRVSQLQKDGSYADVPALLLHAVWWDVGTGEEARYALLPVENGAVSAAAIETHSLEELISPSDDKHNDVSATFNAEILRHPAIVSSPMQSTVDVVFGDTKTNTIHGVTLHPIADTRVHIPVGIGGGSGPGGSKPPLSLAAPPNFTAGWKGPITVIERGDRLAFANAGETALSYITYANGAWASVKSIPIDSRFPAEAALAAVDKMLSTQ